MTTKVIDMVKEGKLMPCAQDVCQECAVKHDPEAPHNKDSLYYQYKFYQREGRWPGWEDAMAHCDDEIKTVIRKRLAELGVSL